MRERTICEECDAIEVVDKDGKTLRVLIAMRHRPKCSKAPKKDVKK